MKKLIMCLTVLAGLLGTLGAQVAAPSIDGIIDANEYAVMGTYDGIALGVTLSADASTLYVAVSSPSTGWVAAGLGALRMNGSYMVLASDDSGKLSYSEDTGTAFGHSPNPTRIVTAKNVKESDGRTTLEFSIPAGNFVKNGKLPMILAYSDKDSFKNMHRKYAKTTLTLSK